MFFKKKVNKFITTSIIFFSLASLLSQNPKANGNEIIPRNRDLNCEIDLCRVERSQEIDCSFENCDRDNINSDLNEEAPPMLIIKNETGDSVSYDIDFRSRISVRKFTREILSDRHLVEYTTNKRMGAVVDFDSDVCQSGIQVKTKLVYASNNNRHNFHRFEKIDSCKIDLRLG